MGEYKTPGVYIKEKNAFGNSVVEAETAIPAFIGYTEIAKNGNDDLTNVPWKISSMTEFVKYFGGAPELRFTVDIKKYHPKATVNGEKEIVPKGATLKPVSSVFQIDIESNEKEQIDNEELDVNYAFCIDGKNTHTLYYQMLMFFANGGGACYVVSVDKSKGIDSATVGAALDALTKEREVTMIVVPEAVNSSECSKIQQEMMKHCGEMSNRFAILDVPQGDESKQLDKQIEDFQNTVTDNFSYGAAYFPWLNTSVLSERDLDGKMVTWNSSVFDYIGQLADVDAAFPAILKAFAGGEEKVYELTPDSKNWPNGDTVDFTTVAKGFIKGGEIINIEEIKDKTATTKKVTVVWLSADKIQDRVALHQALYNGSVLYKQAVKGVLNKLNLLPPSAAMAGIYTRVDNTRGVWKAPANISLNYVNSPAENIDDTEQANLNAPMNGKAINVIRAFRGEGVKVWGARTLDGNSLDWRYINVRRTLIFLEESVRNAARAYVFEPNDAGTWINMKCMIENFLRSVWKRGGLAGATPEDAFEVHVGLGDTMTAEDILEGIMRITVLVAVTHPAEFIEITFQQQMQKS